YALDLAMQIAKNKEFKITVLHMIDFPVTGVIDPVGVTVPPSYDREFLDMLEDKGEKKMEKFLNQVGDHSNLDVEIEVGNAYAGIADRLRKEDYDLIVMGTKGTSGMREFFIGSNTEKVVRTAKCPVIAVHEKVKLSHVNQVVFATSGMEVSEDLMMHVKEMQHIFNAKLHILRVNTPNNFRRDRLVRPMLEKLAERYMLKDYTINIYNDIYEEEGIMTFAHQINADMIALGTHGRKGLAHFIAGSLAEDVVNHAKKLIWTYHIKE
ncbi:MAG: universal stress protein, partial [Fulvivirga sp.]|nr:universal stress protein [Fulvivirga sp.]